DVVARCGDHHPISEIGRFPEYSAVLRNGLFDGQHKKTCGCQPDRKSKRSQPTHWTVLPDWSSGSTPAPRNSFLTHIHHTSIGKALANTDRTRRKNCDKQSSLWWFSCVQS